MKVRCIRNTIGSFKDLRVRKRIEKYFHFDEDYGVGLELGMEYSVFGLVFFDGNPFYYVCDESPCEYPIPFAADFFEITDAKPSSYWHFVYRSEALTEEFQPFTGFVIEPWANDPIFLERLIDGEAYELSVFKKYMQLIESE